MTVRVVDDEKALDRVVFFSDAVFAIAMTLLVLDLRVPVVPDAHDRRLWHLLARQFPSFWSVALELLRDRHLLDGASPEVPLHPPLR